MEDRYRTLIDTTRTGFVDVDPQGQVRDCNAEYVRLTGRTREEVIGRSVWEWTAPYDRQRNQAELASCLALGSVVSLEVDYISPSGKIIPIEVNAAVVRDGERVSVLSICRDIHQRRLSEEALRESLRQVRALVAYQETVREQERTRIARELHDVLGQSLTALKMDVALLRRRLPPSGDSADWIAQHTAQMNLLIDDTIQSMRRVSRELRQEVLEDLGLVEALASHAREFQERFGINCRFESSVGAEPVERSRAAALFRIGQESLTNVARHSGAGNVRVALRREPGELVLEIADDGRGISTDAQRHTQSLGLLGMRERVGPFGGVLEIIGRAGHGTTVTARVPE